jgi:hypothetical protein
MMQRSSRFVSLSGLSGISAGICALIGAALATRYMGPDSIPVNQINTLPDLIGHPLFLLAVLLLIAATTSAYFFTWMKTRKTREQVWNMASRKLLIHILTPLIAGGILILWMILHQIIIGIAATSLIFYGLALINGGKFTLSEITYLGYAELIIGLISLWLPVGMGFYAWIVGFGFLHILYGFIMWWKYERNTSVTQTL